MLNHVSFLPSSLIGSLFVTSSIFYKDNLGARLVNIAGKACSLSITAALSSANPFFINRQRRVRGILILAINP
jgi:hypothetical protein